MKAAIKKGIFPIFFMILIFFVFLILGLMVPEYTIRKIVQDAGVLGPFLLILLFWLANFFAPLSGSPFLFAGFYLYGRNVVIYATIAAVLASISNFMVARRWGRPLVTKLAGAETLERADKFIDHKSIWMVFLIRIVAREMHDVLSYAFGLTALEFWRYFAVSTFGIISASALWYFLAGRIQNAAVFTLFSWILFSIPVTGYFAYILIKNNRKKRGQ